MAHVLTEIGHVSLIVESGFQHGFVFVLLADHPHLIHKAVDSVANYVYYFWPKLFKICPFLIVCVVICRTVSLSRIWSNEKMNQANGYWSSPDHYWGNQMAPMIEIFTDPFWRKFRFLLALSIKKSFLGA